MRYIFSSFLNLIVAFSIRGKSSLCPHRPRPVTAVGVLTNRNTGNRTFIFKQPLVIITSFISTLAFAQVKEIASTYSSRPPTVEVTFNKDSTFQYVTKGDHPIFYRWEDFSEKGKWTLSGDTIILNPAFPKKTYVESDFKEKEIRGDTNLFLTFHHVKRYFNTYGEVVKADTLQIGQLDYSFSEFKKKKQTRVAPVKWVRCTFAGYIPKEIITADHTISIKKPAEKFTGIFIGCYELQGTKEFTIKNPNANNLTLYVYSNYYLEGQIRQVKLLVKNSNILYTKQRKNGEFEKDNI